MMEHTSIEEIRLSMKSFIESQGESLPSNDSVLIWCGAIGSSSSISDDIILMLRVIRKIYFLTTAQSRNNQLPEVILLDSLKAVVTAIYKKFSDDEALLAEIITVLNITITSTASLVICFTVPLEKLLLELVFSKIDFIDKITGTVVMLDLLDFISKLSHVEVARKKVFSNSKFIQFINYVSSSIIEEISITDTFIDMIFTEKPEDPQDIRDLANFQTTFIHNTNEQHKLLVSQRLCGCSYVISISSDKLSNELANTRVPALSFELVKKVIEISSLGVLKVNKELVGPIHSLNRTLAGALAVVISLLRSKHNLKILKLYDFLSNMIDILRIYSSNERWSIISNEICSFACMVLSSLSALSKHFAERMHQMHVLSLLVDIISTCNIDGMAIVFRSAMSAIIDISNALRGTFGFSRMASLIVDMQEHTNPPCATIVDLINKLVSSFSNYANDDESTLYFAEFIQLYTSGSASCDFIRHALLETNIHQLLLDYCSSDTTVIVVKTHCMQAIAKLMRIKTPNTNELLIITPKVISFTLSFMQACNKKVEDPYADLATAHKSTIPMGHPVHEYRKCVSACKEVLEILGHAEGRSKIKYIFYSMLFTGIIFLLVYIAVLLFPNTFKRSYFDQ